MSRVTPEGQVKKKIKELLDLYKLDGIYYYMSVPSGYGESTLDYVGFIRGLGFAIEAKRPGKIPTTRQERIIERIKASNTPVFVISCEAELAPLEAWLEAVRMAYGRRRVPAVTPDDVRNQERTDENTSAGPMGVG